MEMMKPLIFSKFNLSFTFLEYETILRSFQSIVNYEPHHGYNNLGEIIVPMNWRVQISGKVLLMADVTTSGSMVSRNITILRAQRKMVKNLNEDK